MYRHWRLITVIVLLPACKQGSRPEHATKAVQIDKNLLVVIKNDLSSKVDLMKGVYTVFFISKPPVEVNFELTPTEKEQIINKYYSLALYELKEVDADWRTIYIEDECMIMPKLYTYLTIERDSITQEIQIDESCDDYSKDKGERAKRVKAFLEFVNRIIKSKPEVKNAPATDIFYL